jgi:tryptophan synthase beta chain
VPALESAHAVAFALRLGRRLGRTAWILINLSGRGDKDLAEYERIRSRKPVAGSGKPNV